jgi:hypothetical protein
MNQKLFMKLMTLIKQIKYLKGIKDNSTKFLDTSLKKMEICLMVEKMKQSFLMKYKKCCKMQKYLMEEKQLISQ